MAEALHLVIGRPPLTGLVPPASSTTWRVVRASIEAATRAAGQPVRVRSPAALWLALHGNGMPRGVSWGQLLQGHTVQSLVQCAANRRSGADLRIVSWNCRWLTELSCPSGRSKAEAIQQAARAGAVVLIQETHLDEAAMAIWAAGLHGCRVIASHARIGPGGGAAGGVAIVISDRWQVIELRELVPGYAVEAVLRDGGPEAPTLCARSVYLPPRDREDVWQAYELCGPPRHADSKVTGGDLNVPLDQPRTRRETRLAQTIQATLAQHELFELNGDTPTHRTPHSEAALDVLCVTATSAASWHLQRHWKPTHSDHAWLDATCRPAGASTARACTAAAMASLPDRALRDLRLRYASLEVLYGIPGGTLPNPQTPPARPPRLDELLDGEGAHADPPLAASREEPEEDPDIPMCADLMATGRAVIAAMIQQWWRDWRKTARTADHHPLQDELRAATTTSSHDASPMLTQWLCERGYCPGRALGRQEARAWLASWQREEAQARLTQRRLSPWLERRRQYGKHMFFKRDSIRRLRHAGQVLTEPTAIHEALLESRRPIWCSGAARPPGSEALLDAYFRARPRCTPPRPDLGLRRLTGLILAPGGSAPGIDGVPYEALQCGLRINAYFLAQCGHAAQAGDEVLKRTLGPATDLLIWIPKKEGAETTNACRPLQLPTCQRRLFGAWTAGVIGPAIEPHFTTAQAAIRGGHCGNNVRQVFEHLAQRAGQGPRRPGPIWTALFGERGNALWDALANAEDRDDATPACLFFDQSKAFERMEWEWCQAVLRRWGLPEWAVRAAMAITAGRAVASMPGGRRSMVCELLRGLGMGGPASPLIWNASFDPLLAALMEDMGIQAPTFVDDVAALCFGWRHTARTQAFMMMAARTLGLHVEAHECRGANFAFPSAALRAALHRLPVSTSGDDDVLEARGLHPATLEACLGPLWVDARPVLEPCRCHLKTAVVPAQGLDAWARQLRLSPMGAQAVHRSWPYLGITAACRTSEDQPGGPHWTREGLTLVVDGTWGRALDRAEERAKAIGDSKASPADKAGAWNVHVTSLVHYPANLAPCSTSATARFNRALSAAFGAPKWIPAELLTMIGPLFQITGGPKHPGVLATATHLRRWLTQDTWGPAALSRSTARNWNHFMAWADEHGGEAEDYPSWRELVWRIAATDGAAERRAALRNSGPQLYDMIWHMDIGRRARAWIRDKSHGRRWMPTEGEEWQLLNHARGYTEAFHLLRLLAGGVNGAAGLRSAETREQFPTRCTDCGIARPSNTWSTACSAQAGLAWCGACAGGPDPETALWLAGSGDLSWHPAAETLQAAQATVRRLFPAASSILRHTLAAPASPYGACPLCRHGEAGGEHLLKWCAPVHLTWFEATGRTTTLAHGLKHTHDLPLMARLLHQASFLFFALHGRGSKDTQASLSWLRRAIAPSSNDDGGSRIPRPPCEEAEEWHSRHECPECRLDERFRPSLGPSGGSDAALPGGHLAPHYPTGSDGHGALLGLFHSRGRARWPIWISGWRRPRTVRAFQATAEWERSQCRHCGHFRLLLRRTPWTSDAGEITTAPCQWIATGPGHEPALVVTFDGSVHGGCSGAAAVLWGPVGEHGDRPVLATATARSDGPGTVQEAEAQACRLGLALLQATDGRYGRAATIAGDNRLIIDHGRFRSRVRAPGIQSFVDAHTSAAEARGWTLRWALLPRQANQEADRLARAARLPGAAASHEWLPVA